MPIAQILFLGLSILLISSSCSNHKESTNDQFQRIASFKSDTYSLSSFVDTLEPIFKMVFPSSSWDSTKMGYCSVLQGEDIGIASIDYCNGKLALVDQYFSNLKLIDLEQGTVQIGPSMGEGSTLRTGLWLNDVAAFENFYIVPGLDSVFIFNSSLEKTASIKLPRGEKFVWEKGEDEAVIYLDDTQNEDLDIVVSLCKVSLDNHHFYEEIIPLDEFMEWRNFSISGGDTFKMTQLGQDFLFSSSSLSGVISSEINPILEYDAKHICFNDSMICWYNAYPDSLVVQVFRVEQ